MRNVAPISPLKSKLSGKFQRFNAIYRSIEMLKIVEFSKISIKMKNYKTFCKVQTASHLKEIILPTHPHQIKPYYDSETKIFLRRYLQIHRHLLSMCFKNAVLGRQEIVQCNIFSDTKQKHDCWKSQKYFWLCCGRILFLMSSELRFVK